VSTKISFQAGNTNDVNEVSTSLTCTPNYPNQTYVLGSSALILAMPSCTGSAGSVISYTTTITQPIVPFIWINATPAIQI
jgi:hypothetical protein